MPSLSWYVRRLGTMSPREIAWRICGAVRDRADRHLLTYRRGRSIASILRGDVDVDRCGFHVTDTPVGGWADAEGDEFRARWRRRLTARADRIADGTLSYFDLHEQSLGDPIDWNRDHKHGVAAPMRFAASIDYRDFASTGDCKYVWEPSRHHHLVVLGRAYRVTGDVRYAAAAVDQLQSWLDQCPYGVGMQWRSPLEMAIRLINWVWTLDLIGPAGVVDEGMRVRLLRAVDLHLRDIVRKYSRGSSANNHLVGEAAGVFVAASYFTPLTRAVAWRAESRRILSEQITRQSFADGGGREQALGYQLFALQFFLVAGMAARRMGRDFPPSYWAAVGRGFEFLAALREGGEPAPMFGDCDDGYVLDLGSGVDRLAPWMVAAACLFGRTDAFGADLEANLEPATWMLEPAAVEALVAAHRRPTEMIGPRAFPDTGYYLLQCGCRGRPDRISVGFDCGPLGYGSIAAHGHADALSVTLRAFGREVLVDPGTYDYFTYPRWRKYFRSTRGHNTVEVDGEDQSVMGGPFLWTRHARAWCARWESDARGGCVVGEHDGYARLRDPVLHRRSVELDGEQRLVTIRDELIADRPHAALLCFHLAPGCRVRRVDDHRFAVDVDGGTVTMELDPSLSVRLCQGEQDPIGGWVSRGYHRKEAAVSLFARGEARGGRMLLSRIWIEPPAAEGGV